MTELNDRPPPEQGEPTTIAGKLQARQKLGGIVPPVLTAIFAFFMGGLVILASGANPFDAYKGILEGAGIDWFWAHLGNTDILDLSTFNLTQTLLRTTTFAFTGLAVAFAFRCGMFNIGGQGQYTMGVVVGIWVGAYWGDALPNGLHVVVGILLAGVAGALWGGIAGILKATVGAHEVITTIMLNWIAFWFASYCFGQGGPLQNRTPGRESSPSSDSVYDNGVFIPTLWGDEGLQALHYGIFLAVAALIAFWLVMNRTTLGYEVRAVGFVGIAVALLGRSTAIGVGLAAFIFGALDYGTTRGLDPEIFDPTLAGNLSLMIQGLVVLFVGADLLILYLWNLRRKRLASPRVSGRGV